MFSYFLHPFEGGYKAAGLGESSMKDSKTGGVHFSFPGGSAFLFEGEVSTPLSHYISCIFMEDEGI